MKHARKVLIAVMTAALMLSLCAVPASAAAAEPNGGTVSAPGGPVTVLREAEGLSKVEKKADGLFRAKFEGTEVAGTGETVDGVYRFTATETDGEAWHVKLESNYPTVAGRDYRVTYRFSSDVAGKVKFGDFQEYEIREGENEVTGMLIASGGTSYLDLQLGMLEPFTIDFTEIEVEEFADEVEYEDALSAPVNFEKESVVFEKHDQGYAPIFTRSRDGVSIEYVATAWDAGVWKSRLYVKTGLIPEAGERYRVSADLSCDQDMPFEVLFNNDEEEKGYGALYGQNLTGGEVNSCEAVIIGGGDGDELVLQFSLGMVPEEATVKVGNLRVEKIVDHYTSALPAGFALDKVTYTGRTLQNLVPQGYKEIPLTNFSYTGTDTVYEGHDDGYVVSLEESASSATLKISQAPADPADRGVWKAKLYAATGVKLEAGTTYRIKFDLTSTGDQARYEACFDGDYENAYGALYDRSLTAGGTDHVELIVTPDVSHGPLTLRLQMGETDSAAGNTVTLSNVSVEKLSAEYQSAGTVTLSTGGTGNVWETHDNGIEQTLTASGSSAELKVTSARSGGGVWSSLLFIKTGVTPEAGARYLVSAEVSATQAFGDFELVCDNGGTEAGYGKVTGLTLPGGPYTYTFAAPKSGCDELVLRFQLGNSPANNIITVSDIQVRKITDGAPIAITLPHFAYPKVTEDKTENKSFDLETNNGTEAKLTGNGESATATVTKPGDNWHVKFYAKPGLMLEKDQTYTVSFDVTNADNCEVCFKNRTSGDENGFGTETIKDGSVSHTFTANAKGELEIMLKIGNVPVNTAVTVKNVKITKTTTDYIPVTLSNFAYPTVIPASIDKGSFDLEANNGAEAELTGDSLSATATVTKPGADWNVKFYIQPEYVLQAGKTYTINVSVTGASGCQACYKNLGTGEEEGFGTETVASESVSHTVTPAEGGTLEVLLKIGNLPADTEVKVTGIEIIAEADTAEEITPDTVDYWLEPPGEGAGATQDGSSVTIVTPTNDDWKIKFYIMPRLELTAGQKYQVSFDVTNADDCEVCYKNTVSGDEKGFGSERVKNGTVTHTFTAGDTAVMEILLKLGKLPAGTVVTVSNVHIFKLTPGTAPVTLPKFAFPSVVPESVKKNSFDLEANNGAEAKLSGSSGSAIATVTKPGANWNVKFYAQPDFEVKKDQSYQVSFNVTNADKCEVCYKNRTNGDENGFGTETVERSTVTHTFTANADGVLEIMLKIGNVPADTAVELSNVQISEYKTGELDVTPKDFAYPVTTYGTLIKNSFDLETNNGAAAWMSGDGNSATATVTKPGANWHIKFYAKPGVELEAGKTYTIGFSVSGADKCEVCYKNSTTGAEDGFGTETVERSTVTHTFTANADGVLEIMLKIGAVPAGTAVTVSGITITTLGEGTPGENLATASLIAGTGGNLSFWAHEDYAAALSGDGSSASLAISQAPADGREAWKVKLFVETGITLEAGKHYRISADVSADAETDYEICYNNGGKEKGVGALYGLHAGPESQTAVFEATPENAADLVLQFNLGWATAPCNVTVSSVKVEEMTKDAGESVLPSFSYDSAGNLKTAADAGYITELEQKDSSAIFRILQAPDERNPWNVKLFAQTGFTPEKGKGYRVSFDIEAEGSQKLFEVFYDGDTENAYGALYNQSLSAGKKTVSYTILPGDSKGELTVQIRLGKTDGTDGNAYTVSNLKLEEVSFKTTEEPETKVVTTLDIQDGYKESLEKTADRATVRIEKTPAEGKEPWKSKLFVYTGVNLEAGQKYRVSMNVKSIIPAPFEVCFNNGDEEKGLGAMFGLISTPSGKYVEYVTYPRQDTELVIQLSLGNCSAPNSIMLDNVKVEKAGEINPVSDTVYTFS